MRASSQSPSARQFSSGQFFRGLPLPGCRAMSGTGGGRAEKFFGERRVLRARMHGRGVVFDVEREALQRARKLAGGVLGVVDFRVGGEQVFHARAAQVGLEKTVGIEEVADDLLKAGEIGHEIRREHGARDEEAGHRPILDGARGIGVGAAFGEGDDVAVAEDFEMRGGKIFAQQSDRREREDEIANRSAADDENARFHGP